MNVCLSQLNSIVGNFDYNHKLILREAKKALKNNAEIIITPELSLTGYPPEDLLLNKDFLNKAEIYLKKIAEKKLKIKIIVGHPSSVKGKLYNSASIIFNGKVIKTYHKQTLPNYGVFDEKRYFSEGKESLIYNHNGKKIGLLICEDIWVDQPLKELEKKGVEIIICINASPYELNKRNYRLTSLQNKFAKKNITLIYVNNVGGQDDLLFDGASFIFNAKNKLLVELKQFEEQSKTVNTNDLNHTSLQTNPLIEVIFNGLCLSLKDYLKKNNIDKVILGLSGGIDSAVVAVIASRVCKNVSAIMMPTEFTTQDSLVNAKTLASNLKIAYKIKNIDALVKKINKMLEVDFKGLNADITEENIQARARGLLLMAYANKFNGIVLATGNKSELAVGYSTIYGDMVGGFSLLKDVPKTLVYQLAEYINSKSEIIPTNIIERPPTAELRHNQTDQDNLPDYQILDTIIDLYIEQNLSPTEIIKKGFESKVVKKVVKLIHNNEFKRRQSAPGPKITFKAFGKERRYPITNNFS